MSVIDWDDIRYFLAVAHGGSVRAGAEQLAVRHSTVLRRLSQLEERLGARLFDRLPSGYRLTDAGGEVLDQAEQMARSSHRLETLVAGRDQTARGPLRVTMTPMLASHLLMPDMAAFARLHPGIALDILASDAPANLHGRKGPDLFGSVYLSADLLAGWRAEPPRPLPWIVKPFDGVPVWAAEGSIPIGDGRFTVTEAGAHIAAAREGIGLTALPCFIGDADPLLARAPDAGVHRHGTLYLLTQGETRRTRRVGLFTEFMAGRLAAHAGLLAGQGRQGGS